MDRIYLAIFMDFKKILQTSARACCSIVCLVPHGALPDGSLAVHPVQMMVMTPVEDLITLPELESMSLVDPSGSSSWPWMPQMPHNEVWTSEEHASEHLQMASPTTELLGQVCEFNNSMWQYDVQTWHEPEYTEAPLQLHMDMYYGDVATHDANQAPMEVLEPQTELDVCEENCTPIASKCTIRRRRRHQKELLSSTREALVQHDEPAEQAVSEAEAAQARKLAHELSQQLRLGGPAREAALAKFEHLTFNSKVSSRAAQLALQEASASDMVALVSGLRGRVREAVESKYANYVIQKMMELLPVVRTGFVVEELVGTGADVARHRCGCRIICRILEHGSLSEGPATILLNEVLNDAESLCNHTYGNHVARHILEYGLLEHRQKVICALSSDLMTYAKHRHGSHVVEAALRHGSWEVQHRLVGKLLSDEAQLFSLTTSQFGRHVVRALLGMQQEFRQRVVAALTPVASQLQATRYGKSVVHALRLASS